MTDEAVAITWLFVTICPFLSYTHPEPVSEVFSDDDEGDMFTTEDFTLSNKSELIPLYMTILFLHCLSQMIVVGLPHYIQKRISIL